MSTEIDTTETARKYFQPTWESKIAFYREWITEWDTSAMVNLLKRLSQAKDSHVFYPIVTSHDWLCISTEQKFEKAMERDYVAINYDDHCKVFHLHYTEVGRSKIEKGEYDEEGQMLRAVESALLRMKIRNESHGAV